MRNEDREGSEAIGTKIRSVDTKIWPGEEGPVQRVTRECCEAVRLFCNLIMVAVVAVVVYNIYITVCLCENLENYIPKTHT